MNDFITFPDKDLWEQLERADKPIFIYGMGNGADKIANELARRSVEVCGYFASDGFVRGQSFRGKRVMSYSEVERAYADFIVLVAFGTRLESVIAQVENIAAKHELYLPDVPVAGEALFTLEFAKAHEAELNAAFEAFDDSRSRELYKAIINYKLTGRLGYLLENTSELNEMIGEFDTASWRRIADLGAYTGDTVKLFSDAAPRLCEAIAFEPDSKNFKKLEAAADTLNCKLEAHNLCAWSRAGELVFLRSGNRNSTVAGLAHVPSVKDTSEKRVSADSLDNILEHRKVDFIKFDVEGSESEALDGCLETIKNYAPEIMMSVYHRSEDLFVLPLRLKSLLPDKRLLLRRTGCLPAWELNACLTERK